MHAVPFQIFQELDLPLSEVVSGRIGFIHDLFMTFPYEITGDLPEGDQDLVVLTGKGDRREKLERLIEYPGRVLLVLAPGDAPFKLSYMPGRHSLPPNIIAAYVTNNEIPDQRAINIPLGIRIDKLRTLKFVRRNHTGGQDRLVYGNFTLNDEHYRPDKKTGEPHIRARIVDRLQDADWCTMEVNKKQKQEAEALVHYYSQIAGHRFVLSPEGNGIDCYRTWESLYLGAIPIVMVSTCMSTFSDLPILFTDDYSEITEDYLEQRWEEFSQRSFDLRQLLKSHYLHHFLSTIGAMRNPRFICWGFGGTPEEKFLRVLERSSRSASDIVAEAPTPPFVERLALSDPKGWTEQGSVRVERRHDSLKVIAGESPGGNVETTLQTIAGAPFRLTGKARADRGHDAAELTISTEDGGTKLASYRLDGEMKRDIDLRFLAEGDTTLLSLSVGDSEAGTSCMLSELTLSTEV